MPTAAIDYDTAELNRFIADLRGTLWAASASDLDQVEQRLRRVVDNIVEGLNVQPHAPDFGEE